MKSQPKLTSFNPAGKWRIVAFYLNVETLGWTLTKRYGIREFIWIMSPDGKLIEKRKGRDVFVTSYTVIPQSVELEIDRRGFDKGHCNCYGNRYKVEVIGRRIVMLYDLDSINPGSDKFKYRLKLKKQRTLSLYPWRSRFGMTG